MTRHRVGAIIAHCLLVTLTGIAAAQSQQVAQASAFLARMGATGSTVRHQLEEARAQRDVVRTICLNDKLNQVDVAIRSARDRRAALEQAVLQNDAEQADHAFMVLGLLRRRVEQLGIEANQCVGITELLNQTSVTVTVDPTLPSLDLATYPENPLALPPPPIASPVR